MTKQERIDAHQDLLKAIALATSWLAEFWEAEFELSMGVDEPGVDAAVHDAHTLINAAALPMVVAVAA
jgi:hypothetical protein